MSKNMTRDQIYEILTPIFQTLFENPSICLYDTMTAKDVSQWDSLNYINLIITVEQKFNIRFTTAEVASLQNVGQFVDTVLKKSNAS